MLDFVRIACAVPKVSVGNVKKNTADICSYMEKAEFQGVDVLLFPELCLTGYTCGDLFFQDALHVAVRLGLREILEYSKKYPNLISVIGLPVKLEGKLYNCAAVISDGDIGGLVPKTRIPGGERRWFTSGMDVQLCLDYQELGICTQEEAGANRYVELSTKQLFCVGNVPFGVEICEDAMAPKTPSLDLAVNGAQMILNLSASPEFAGKRVQRREMVKHLSESLNCVYAYCSAGVTESTTDMVYSGHSLIGENGSILAENDTVADCDYMLLMDCDLGKINADRIRSQYFETSAGTDYTRNHLGNREFRGDGSLYAVNKLPFIPADQQTRKERCLEIFRIQAAGLRQRLETVGANPVLGISGGLDSTLALLVAVEAMRSLGRPLTDVHGITMPCFGTSDRTYRNSWELMRKLGISAKEINIRSAVTQHFADIGHDMNVHNGTYENSQARERTQILMDYAGVVGGLVVGTGDLSELALGWCTYNGDHMSMYAVNGTVPKTLIRWIIEAVSELPDYQCARDVLADILDTPISPELLPPDAQGKIAQKTEDLVGPYALHDFFLYYTVRYGYTPTKIYTLACRGFASDFDRPTVKKWLKSFYRRFFTQQFKRNCQPDGVKAGSVGLGPRGDWQMPSDAAAALWLEEAEGL